MINALDQAGSGRSGGSIQPMEESPSRSILAELMAEAGSRVNLPEPATWLTMPDGEQVLRSRFSATQLPSPTEGGMEEFRKEWNGLLLRTGKNALVFQINAPTAFWKRLFSRPPAVQVEVQWARSRPPTVPLPEVTVHIRSLEKGCAADLALLRQLGSRLLESLRTLMQGHPERRTQERRLWTRPVQATFLLPDGQVSEPVECFGKDVSLNGMGLYLPCVVPGPEVQVSFLTRSRSAPVTLAGKCVRVQRCGEDWYEAGIHIA